MSAENLLIHKHEDGGASFGWLRDPSVVDWDYWRPATEDEIATWIIMKLLRSVDCRDAAFRWAVDRWDNDPIEALRLLSLISDIEDGKYQVGSK